MKKKTKFDRIVDGVLENENGWNKEVKDKVFQIEKKDSRAQKVIKIYRYLNLYGK